MNKAQVKARLDEKKGGDPAAEQEKANQWFEKEFGIFKAFQYLCESDRLI